MAAADYRLMTEATGQRIAAALEALSGFGAYLTTADVVNNLTSTDPTKVLSAPQGKELNDKISNLIKKIDYTGEFAITRPDDGRYYTEIDRETLGIPNATLLFAQFGSVFNSGETLGITSQSNKLYISAVTSRTVTRIVRVFYIDAST